ncbi:hypothetical protein [Streptomyces sp. JV178]|uniref:hypothetical protein n=1 Tax=Streptomyces sp. JV178 TaxID=858632 RepID=UPI0015D55930|nr:hypothetical protein [Streptomyces sp. JV178]
MTATDPMRLSRSVAWALWLLVIVLFSMLVAVCVAALKYATGARIPDSMLYAGGAFGTTAGLCFAAVGAVTTLRNWTTTDDHRDPPRESDDTNRPSGSG